MAQHARLKIDVGLQIVSAIRRAHGNVQPMRTRMVCCVSTSQKGTDLSVHSADEVAAVAAALNTRPRKTLEWKTFAEALDQLLQSTNKKRVARTA